MDSDTALSASSFSALYQFQGRIDPTTNKAWHGPFPESAVAPLDLRWRDYEMRKGFTRKPKADEPATQGKNYITPSAVKTPTISTASGGCARSMGGFVFSGSEWKLRKWWTRKLRERGKRPR